MRGSASWSRFITTAAATAVLVMGGSAVAAAAAESSANGYSAADSRHAESLEPLTDLAAERILLGDKVAAAKFGTTQPIDDPVREQQVLDRVMSQSVELGLDPAVSVRFFRDQIEANKDVQRGLYALWTSHPELQPKERPDLATEVRPRLDKITTEVLDQLRTTVHVRAADRLCRTELSRAASAVTVRQQLDELHRQALSVALGSVCVVS